MKAHAQYSDEVEFESCTGHVFGNPNKQKNNDLASHINKLVAQGHMSTATQAYIFDSHLVGYSNPNDNEFQEACDLAMGREENTRITMELTAAANGDVNGRGRKRTGLKIFAALIIMGLVGVSIFVVSNREKFNEYWKENIVTRFQNDAEK